MSERVCLIHHLQEIWEDGYRKFGTSFEEESQKIVDYLRSEQFDRVILILFEDISLQPEHFMSGLADYVDEVEEYGYGWERESVEEQFPEGEGSIWADGCSHSEVVMLDDWIKDLKGKNVTLTGAFDGECIETLSTALDHCGVKYTREEGLIVGSGVDYRMRFAPEGSPEEALEKIAAFTECQPVISPFDKHSQRTEMLEILAKTDFEDARSFEVINEYHCAMFGASRGFVTNCEDTSLLGFDGDRYDETEALEFDEIDIEDIEAVDIVIKDNQFIVHEDSYALFKAYQDLDVPEMPVHIVAIEDDPYDAMGIDWKHKHGYERLQHAAQRKIETPGAHFETPALS